MKIGTVGGNRLVGDSLGSKADLRPFSPKPVKEIEILAARAAELLAESYAGIGDERAADHHVSRVSGLNAAMHPYGARRVEISSCEPGGRGSRIDRIDGAEHDVPGQAIGLGDQGFQPPRCRDLVVVKKDNPIRARPLETSVARNRDVLRR